ncbi:MAG: hypothetical protein Q7T85_12525 [Nitrosomonas sp.]|nr:hypothetical protein [Nitrosomonas sp.]
MTDAIDYPEAAQSVKIDSVHRFRLHYFRPWDMRRLSDYIFGWFAVTFIVI